jgi:hypothetical protein
MVSFLLALPSISYIYIYLVPIRATCPAHLILLDLIILIVLGEELRNLGHYIIQWLGTMINAHVLYGKPEEKTSGNNIKVGVGEIR